MELLEQMSCNKDSENLPVIVGACGSESQCGKCQGACQCAKTHTYKPIHTNQGSYNTCCEPKQHGYVPLPLAPCNTPSAVTLFAQTDNEFNFPEVGFTADVTLPGVRLAIGQPLTNDEYGTLHVAMVVDECRGEYKLENRAESNNDADKIGKPVFCGTKFFLSGPTTIVSGSTSSCNSLTADFHIPSVGQQSPATVESFDGFAVGFNAIIRNKLTPTIAYTYEVASFSGTNKVILENIGAESGTPGETLKALDCDECLWCVEAVDPATICEQAVETQIIYSILGCDEEGNIVKIRGANENEALLFDDSNPEDTGYTNKIVDQTSICRQLASCIQIPIYDTEVDPCSVPSFFIETTDDAFILAELADVLLTETGDPIVEICGYPFRVDLSESAVGAIKIIPTFNNPSEVIKLDESCSVCVPEDCCAQCNPQVNFPIAELSPNAPGGFGSGLTLGYGMTIPQAAVPGAGEYRFTVVQDLAQTTYYTFAHDLVTGNVTAAYDPAGTVVPLGGLPGDVDTDYAYYQLEYVNLEKCPVRAYIEEDVLATIQAMQDGFCANVNHYGLILTSNCLNPATPDRSAQYSNTMFFDTPIKVAASANQNEGEAWITDVPTILQPYNTQSRYNRRSFQLEVGDQLSVKITPFYLISADAAATQDIEIRSTSTILLASEVY